MTLIALVVPTFEDRASLIAALVAGLISVFAFTMPYKIGLLVAAFVGITAGVFLKKRL